MTFKGATRINGNLTRNLGMLERYTTRIRGDESKDGFSWEPIHSYRYTLTLNKTCNLPDNPIKYVSNPLLVKLSAWFIILGLRPISPKTKIATV